MIQISRWCSGERPIPKNVLEKYEENDYWNDMEEDFRTKIIPNLINELPVRSQLESLLDESIDVIEADKIQEMKQISDNPQYTEKQLHQFITVIAKCRNVCAHGERLFDFHTTDMIPDTLLHSKLGITRKKGLYQNGKKDLFAVVIALRYLIPNEEFKIFRKNLSLLIKDVLKKCPHLTEDQLLKEMGFPKNWAKIMRYKK